MSNPLEMEATVRLLPAAAAILVLSGVGALAQSDLPRSGQCGFRDGGFAYAGGIALPITMIMKNDGGWCGSLVKTVFGSIVIGVKNHVTRQPAHGQVSITVLSGGTNVYYKPDPGYHGPDSFAVLNEMLNIERVYNVVVR
jgi:hypothetical protein